MATIRASNNPAMLIFAREEVGYTLEQAATAIGVSVDVLQAAEENGKPLTLNQLRKAAELYNFPFGYFYLSKPPHSKTFKPVPDFRIEPGLKGIPHFRLNLEIKKARELRETYLELRAELGTQVDQFSVFEKSTEGIGGLIRDRLGVNDRQLISLPIGDVYPYWKERIENDGVLVYESQYIPNETGVIGAALFYNVCPIILIKRGGVNERKLFTLLHEYAHLLLGQSAINDESSQTIRNRESAEADLEIRCNQLAAEILIPSDKLGHLNLGGLSAEEKMLAISAHFKVTYSTAAVCLRRQSLISHEEFIVLLKQREEAHQREKAKKALVGREVKIPREILMRLDLGKPMFNTVLEAYSNGHIDIFDTSKLLNLRLHKIDGLIAQRK